jgi:hypothetical protein
MLSLSTDVTAHVLECVTPMDARWLALIAMMRTSKHMRDAAITWLRSMRELHSNSLPVPLSKIAAILGTGSLRSMTFDDEHDNAIVTISSHCPALAVIDVDVSFPVTDRAMASLVHFPHALHHANKTATTTALTHVTFGGAFACACSMTDAGVVALARGSPHLSHLSLSLAWTSNVTDASVVALASCCPLLTHLTLKSSNVTDEGVKLLVKLRHLDLQSSQRITGSTAHCCVQLETLVLRNCFFVRELAVEALAARCHHLRHVDFAGCRNVSDAAVRALATDCRQLRHVDLGYCIHVSDDGVGALAAQCDHLEYVDVTACYGVSSMGRVLIQSKGARCVVSDAVVLSPTSILASLF